jgi:hypothetical protein
MLIDCFARDAILAPGFFSIARARIALASSVRQRRVRGKSEWHVVRVVIPSEARRDFTGWHR